MSLLLILLKYLTVCACPHYGNTIGFRPQNKKLELHTK